jgi:hypothetical protein
MTREEFYKLTDILNTEVLGNFMHGGEADELIAMFEEAVEHSNILEQEEPVSEDLEEEMDSFFESMPVQEYENIFEDTFKNIARHFANWQKQQDQSTIELAEDHAMFAGMEKMKEEMMKNIWKPADGDDLPEIDREVVVFTKDFPNDAGIMAVAIGHRPNPEGWDGKSLSTGKVEHYMPQCYDKGGWNIPNVKYWLDTDLPNMEG